MTEVLRELKARHAAVADALEPERLARLVEMVDAGALSGRGAKEVLAAIWGGAEEPEAAMGRLGLSQVRDAGEIAGWVEAVLRDHPGPVAQFREGKTKALGFLVGEVMKRSSGRADPRQARDLLGRSLDRPQDEPGEEIASSRQLIAPD
jgi:aspartyl-tRNA(Asn)/glutamyl-tRNA(Gln) amidotransferase subunit B